MPAIDLLVLKSGRSAFHQTRPILVSDEGGKRPVRYRRLSRRSSVIANAKQP